jgi:hypothetical protein
MASRVIAGSLCLATILCALTGCGENNLTGPGVTKLAQSEACFSNNCHQNAVSPGTGKNIAQEWILSVHNTSNAASCADCHEPAPGHPNSCNLCHGGTPSGAPETTCSDVTVNPDAAGKCYKCHGPGSTVMPLAGFPGDKHHFVNSSSASYIITSDAVIDKQCRNCHNPHQNTLLTQHTDWAASGHGAVTDAPFTTYDFKTRGTAGVNPATSGAVKDDCVRCHTTTGYINFVNSGLTNVAAWAQSTDLGKQTIFCYACHYDSNNGRSYDYARRQVPTAKGFYNFSTANGKVLNVVSFPDVGESNLCLHCHVGRDSGATIKLVAATGVNFSKQGLLQSHYLSGGGTVYRTTGYQFYSSSAKYSDPSYFEHGSIGVNGFLAEDGTNTGTGGPCIGCHMSPDRHTLSAVGEDSSGNISSIDSPMCVHCHYNHGPGADYSWTTAKLQAQQDGFNAALAALQLALNNHTPPIYFVLNYPYVVSIPNGTAANQFINFGNADTMGATFNYMLLLKEPGAWAHNDYYTRRLIYDSIDYIDNGLLDNSVEATINALSGLTSTQKTNAINYLLKNGSGGTRY